MPKVSIGQAGWRSFQSTSACNLSKVIPIMPQLDCVWDDGVIIDTRQVLALGFKVAAYNAHD